MSSTSIIFEGSSSELAIEDSELTDDAEGMGAVNVEDSEPDLWYVTPSSGQVSTPRSNSVLGVLPRESASES